MVSVRLAFGVTLRDQDTLLPSPALWTWSPRFEDDVNGYQYQKEAEEHPNSDLLWFRHPVFRLPSRLRPLEFTRDTGRDEFA
jgi:hypothetical protein